VSFFFENSDEFVADDFAFLLRIGNPSQLAKKTLSRIYSHDMQAELVTQVLLNFFEFILAQHTVIDEDAGEAGGTIAVAQSTINQRSRYGGVHPGEELGFCNDLDFSMPILALLCRIYFSAEHVDHQLQSITNPQNGHSEFENAWVSVGGVGIVDRARASGENDSSRRLAANFIQRSGTRKDDGKNIQFADAARDELRILCAEVENNDGLRFHRRVSQIVVQT